MNKETTRRIMTEIGLYNPKSRKQPKKRYVWRERKDNYVEIQQFDGSYHNWFGKESCLLLSVDDATGKITHAKFDYNEGTVAVFKFYLEYFNQNGLPLLIYLDKFSTYKVNHKNAVDNKDLITQFQRAINQVDLNPITAHSLEAKDRVERMNGMLQDRLVKELRLANIKTIEKANEFLKEYIPKFNAKFAVVPKREANLHKELDKKMKERLPQIFSVQNERKVNINYTVRFKNKFYQLNETQPTTVYKKDSVVIEEHLNGTVKINLKGHYLNYLELPERPKKEINIKLPAITNRKQSSWKPPINHPWRRCSFTFKKKVNIEQLITN
ncbi:MAG: ISNCY family transposase [Patescibacteria group bacterium]|nr:ISNCY family transposase [Patescibacteria group bacterium]